jgi:ABC-type glycerol-3-phosphate transport system substrate-binding protein
MKKTTLVILATTVLAALAAGCATTTANEGPRAEAVAESKPVTRPFSGVGSYGGYTYRRYE